VTDQHHVLAGLASFPAPPGLDKLVFKTFNIISMRKILVPCDFSVAAHRAYQFAGEVAAANNGQVIVLHVVEMAHMYGNGMAGQPYAAVDPVTPISEVAEKAQKSFDRMQKIIGPISAPVRLSVQIGSLTDTILKTIAEENIDLVVMATGGAHGLKAFFVGSNTEKIVRASPIPVFALHKSEHVGDVRNIIFPTCLDLTQGDLVSKVKTLQQVFDAVVHVLYINNYPTSLIRDEEVEASLKDYAKFYGLRKYTLNVRRGSDLGEAIIQFAGKVPHSIIAMSTHGYSGFDHFLKGSVGEEVVNHSTEPVWTYVSPQPD
jgi:nucleotide-binding universal stress UspA family protein